MNIPWPFLSFVDRLEQAHPSLCPYCQAWPSDLCALHRNNWINNPSEAATERRKDEDDAET